MSRRIEFLSRKGHEEKGNKVYRERDSREKALERKQLEKNKIGGIIRQQKKGMRKSRGIIYML